MYYMQKGGGWVHIACKIANALNGRTPISIQGITHGRVGAEVLQVCHSRYNMDKTLKYIKIIAMEKDTMCGPHFCHVGHVAMRCYVM